MTQQNHRCQNIMGQTRYRTELLQHIPIRDRMEYILKYGTRDGKEFCEHHCPVGRWYRRYEKSLDAHLEDIRRDMTC